MNDLHTEAFLWDKYNQEKNLFAFLYYKASL